jgi:hypothetical protein
MTFIAIRGFYPEPDPDNSLQYEKDVPVELEANVLAALGWKSQYDLPPGVTELTPEQAQAIMALLGDPMRDELMYCIGLYR